MIPPWSYTALSTFENCPRQYYRRYILKEKEPETSEMKWGNEVHKQLEERLKFDKPLPEGMRQWEPLAGSVKKAARGKDLQTEFGFGVESDLKPCDFFSKRVWGRGKADILVVDDTAAWIGDWKTGKPREKEFQLGVFAGFVFAWYPRVKRIAANNLWLKEHKAGPTYYFSRENDMATIWAAIHSRVKQIEACMNAGSWPERPSGLCGWCHDKTCKHNPHKDRDFLNG